MPTTAQQLAEHDFRDFYLTVHGDPPDWLSGTSPIVADACSVSRADFLRTFLDLHPQLEVHREFLARLMTQLHAFPVSRAVWRQVVGNEDVLPDRQLSEHADYRSATFEGRTEHTPGATWLDSYGSNDQ